jgi:hypothetical protein
MEEWRESHRTARMTDLSFAPRSHGLILVQDFPKGLRAVVDGPAAS